jgi:biopolymer transport protein ExbD
MKYLLEVCLVAATLSASSALVAQSGIGQFESRPESIPTLRPGISVTLPVTRNAASVPKADKEDAVVVTITDKSEVYFGVNPTLASDLPEKVKGALVTQTDKVVYIKADARAPYASVVKVLDSLRASGVEGVTFLTAQGAAPTPGTPVPPKGLEMLVVGSGPRNSSNLY